MENLGEKRTTYKVLFGKQKEVRVSFELGVDVMIILKYILKRQDGRTWNRYLWLEDREKRLAVVNTEWTFGLYKIRIIFWLLENPWAIRGNFCCVKLVVYWSMIILGKLIVVQLIEELHASNWIRQTDLIGTRLVVYFFRPQTSTQGFMFISSNKRVIAIGDYCEHSC